MKNIYLVFKFLDETFYFAFYDLKKGVCVINKQDDNLNEIQITFHSHPENIPDELTLKDVFKIMDSQYFKIEIINQDGVIIELFETNE